MKTKFCSKCNIDKPVSEFYKRDKNSYNTYCKTCFNNYCSERWIQKKIAAIIHLGSKCNTCSISYPEFPYVIFDFHHIEPTTKNFDWDKMKLQSHENLFKELNKCILLCANCHRIKHHTEHLMGVEPTTFSLEAKRSSS